jgi:hypothetical protein
MLMVLAQMSPLILNRKEQARNRRDNSLLEHDGSTMTIVEWSEATGIKACTISKRIHARGWTIEEALTTPVGQKRKTRNQ